MNIEKMGRDNVRCDSASPWLGIRSNGMRMPDRKIWGMKMIGSQLTARVTDPENALTVSPSNVPETVALETRTTDFGSQGNDL